MKRFLIFVFCWQVIWANAQVDRNLVTAMDAFNKDPQLKFALSSLYVVDGTTGEVVFDQNSSIGMATASTEKIVTAATALDVLGADYRYETRFGIVQTPKGKSLWVVPSGDPTLASWRWEETKDLAFLNRLKKALVESGTQNLASIMIFTGGWANETIPGSWIWDDLGNYYGAGCQPINWRENQFDLTLRSGNTLGSPVTIVKTTPYLYDYAIQSVATAADTNSGDNSLLYYPSMGSRQGILRGTIPAKKSAFVVSGSIYDPANQFAKTIIQHLKGSVRFSNQEVQLTHTPASKVDWIYTNQSPAMSSIVHWFLRKSINLYGESLLKSLGANKSGMAGTDAGIEAVKAHWKSRGVEEAELNIYDGSGLSPQNRITTRAQVVILKYAQKQSWFPQYYEGFPVFNDMKMKSGTINRVKGYSGYHQSKSGKKYIFAFLINNYNGSQYSLIRKMYTVLDVLK